MFEKLKTIIKMKTMTKPTIESQQVQTSYDYDKFKPISGNRNLNPLHKARLKKSMENNYLFTTIIVNENLEIIDGQHRFSCIKDLGLPLHYIICKGYGLKEVHILNENSKNWNIDDYLEGYCNLGYEEYLIYRDFKNKYKLNHSICLALLGKFHDKRYFKVFFGGDFQIGSYKKACELAEKILSVEPYYDGCKNREFVKCLISLMKNKNFDFEQFIQKLKLQPKGLVHCRTVESYKLLIEDLYNYKSRVKVNLRY